MLYAFSGEFSKFLGVCLKSALCYNSNIESSVFIISYFGTSSTRWHTVKIPKRGQNSNCQLQQYLQLSCNIILRISSREGHQVCNRETPSA